jgi:uncharacterized protein
MSRIYWDTMLFVYWLEDHPLYAKRVRRLLSQMEAAAGSALHQLIYRRRDSARPLQIGLIGDSETNSRGLPETAGRSYRVHIRDSGLLWSDSAQHGVSPADSIHLACAAQAWIDLFLTNDAALVGKIIPGIQFIAGLDSNLF